MGQWRHFGVDRGVDLQVLGTDGDGTINKENYSDSH
jgi:hypothetical protein